MDKLFTVIVESVYSINAPHHRPKRYGAGRFIKKLAALGIVRPSTMDQLVERMEEKNYIEIEAKIIVPTKMGKRVDAWMSLELPEINSLENAALFEDKIDQCTTEEEADALIQEYHDLTFSLLSRKGVHYKKNKGDISDAQIAYAKKLAIETGVVLEDSFYQNGEEVLKFITQCHNSLSLGKCPLCKKGRIIEKEKVFVCDNFQMNCQYKIFKESSIRFFDHYEKSVDIDFVRDVVRKALNASPILLTLNNPRKKGEEFNAHIVIDSSKPPFGNLGLSFKSKNSARTNGNGQNFNEHGQGNTNITRHYKIDSRASGEELFVGLKIKIALARAETLNYLAINDEGSKILPTKFVALAL